ncbi:hypothetical protein GGG16DRAFT_66752, partial [Schizophyllum commune]
SYRDIISLLSSLRITGVQSGITLMQAANNCTLLGLCQPPSVEDMAIIALSINRGATAGMQALGLAPRDRPAYIAAFRLIYHYLDSHLSDQDKETLSFNPIFVEHLLCKVQRFKRELEKCDLNMDTLVSQEQREGHRWQRGANMKDEIALPLPLRHLTEEEKMMYMMGQSILIEADGRE